MFSSLASFIFGSNTSATTNSEVNQNPPRQDCERECEQQTEDDSVRIDADNTIEVTSSTPSVTGSQQSSNALRQPGRRGKNKRNKQQKNKTPTGPGTARGGQLKPTPTPTPTITKLLTPSESFEEDLDEDDWFIVEKEDEDVSLPRSDSEEELSIVEVKPKPTAAPPRDNQAQAQAQQQLSRRRQQHITSHSLYSGPRPQQQRNYLQRARNSGARGAQFSVSTLSPPRSIGVTGPGNGSGAHVGAGATAAAAALADSGLTQSLYVVSPSRGGDAHNTSFGSNSSGGSSSNGFGAYVSMEESWFVTPPPCFTSIGPVNMETSPFENLLIEHPSMSVYHSIRSAQQAAESFVNLDLGVEESQQNTVVAPTTAVAPNARGVQSRATGPRLDRYTATQLKQELCARNSQRQQEKKERQSLCRGAIKRSNKVRDFQSKSQRQRRADMQHCKIISGANNNRKCCF